METRSTRTLLGATLAALLLPALARADFDPPKFIQMPDLTPSGVDVNATWKGPLPPDSTYPFRKILADDFLCVSTDPITDIHIWGSWLNDQVDPAVFFKLSIHEDVPANFAEGIPSHPGAEVWSRIFTRAPSPSGLDFVERLYAQNLQENFWDPDNHVFLGTDTQVWQYNFNIPPAEAFVQQGTFLQPKVYWLDVQAILPPIGTDTPIPSPAVFGWKTSFQHYNDDAVYADTSNPGIPTLLIDPPGWQELNYPGDELVGNPLPISLWGTSMDMAFVITPEPGSLSLLGIGALALLRRKR